MIPGATLCILSHISTSFATKYYQLLLSQGFLFGVRNAMLYVNTFPLEEIDIDGVKILSRDQFHLGVV